MSIKDFELNIAKLSTTPGRRMNEKKSGLLSDLKVSTSWIKPPGVVEVDVLLEAVHSDVLVSGTIQTQWQGICRRCLGDATGIITCYVRELFEPNSNLETTYLLQSDRLDLEPLARDAILLELPVAPLCIEDCLGLCLHCGINHNEDNCDCNVGDTDPRWAALESLKFDDSSSQKQYMEKGSNQDQS